MKAEAAAAVQAGFSPKEVFYPEVAAGGFTRCDGTVQFYTRVNALLRPNMTVLDFGAGRGQGAEDPVEYRRRLRTLKGKVRRVIGLDIDRAVLDNPLVDEAGLIRPGSPLPVEDRSVDLIVSDNTFEHLDDPAFIASEFARMLRPGGWICARTPNRWSYVAAGARMVPASLHHRLLRRLQPAREERDVFPAFYRLNSFAALRRHFPDDLWRRHIYAWNPEPAYCGTSATLWRTGKLIQHLSPEALCITFMVFIQRIEISG